MGLLTDSFFIRAIKSNSDLLAKLPAGDIYNNVADPDFDMENVELPYIVVNNDGGQEGADRPQDDLGIYASNLAAHKRRHSRGRRRNRTDSV